MFSAESGFELTHNRLIEYKNGGNVLPREGIRMAARMAIIAMTTSSSISVNADRVKNAFGA